MTRRLMVVVVLVVGGACVLSYAVPAVGGPDAFSSANPVKLAKRALKSAKRANKKAKQADAKASRALTNASRTAPVLGAGITEVKASKSVPPGAVDYVDVSCPAGTLVVSGGWTVISGAGAAFWDHSSGNGWSVGVDNFDSISTDADSEVVARCAPAGNAVIASHARRDHARDAALLRKQRAKHQR